MWKEQLSRRAENTDLEVKLVGVGMKAAVWRKTDKEETAKENKGRNTLVLIKYNKQMLYQQILLKNKKRKKEEGKARSKIKFL